MTHQKSVYTFPRPEHFFKPFRKWVQRVQFKEMSSNSRQREEEIKYINADEKLKCLGQFICWKMIWCLFWFRFKVYCLTLVLYVPHPTETESYIQKVIYGIGLYRAIYREILSVYWIIKFERIRFLFCVTAVHILFFSTPAK